MMPYPRFTWRDLEALKEKTENGFAELDEVLRPYRDAGLLARQQKKDMLETCEWPLGSQKSMAFLEGYYNSRMPRPTGHGLDIYLSAIDTWVDDLPMTVELQRVFKLEYGKIFGRRR